MRIPLLLFILVLLSVKTSAQENIDSLYYVGMKLLSEATNNRDTSIQVTYHTNEYGQYLDPEIKSSEGYFYYDSTALTENKRFRFGKWTYWHLNGQIKAEFFYNNHIKYIVNYWDESGKQTVINGNGKMTIYDLWERNKWCESFVKDSLINGPRTCYDSIGIVTHYTFFKDGYINGLSLVLNKNGQLRYQGNYLNGHQHGMSINWYPNGNYRTIMHYDHGILDGLRIYMNEEGDTTCKELFKNGMLTEIDCIGSKYYSYK